MSPHQTVGPWLPLTLPQLDFWEEFLFHPDEAISTVAHCIAFEGPVEEALLVEAIARTVAESEVLWLRFSDQPDGPRQACDPEKKPRVELRDLRENSDPEAEAQRQMQADVEVPLDLRRDMLSAQMVFRVRDDRYLWYVRAHHILLDGYGLSLIEHRCAALYRHLRDNEPAGEPFFPLTHFLQEEDDYRTGRRHGIDRDFWQTYLAQVSDLPVIYKGSENYGETTFDDALAFNDEFSDRLQSTAEALKIGWPDLLVLIAGLYLHETMPRQPAQDGEVLVVWLPFMSRWGSVGAHMPGMLVNILPILLSVKSGESLSDYLVRSAAVLRKQRQHGRYRIEQIAMDRALEKGNRFYFSPLINVLPFSPPQVPGLIISRHVLANGPDEGVSLTFRGSEEGRGLTLRIEADSSVLDKSGFETACKALPRLLRLALSERGLRQDARSLAAEALGRRAAA